MNACMQHNTQKEIQTKFAMNYAFEFILFFSRFQINFPAKLPCANAINTFAGFE